MKKQTPTRMRTRRRRWKRSPKRRTSLLLMRMLLNPIRLTKKMRQKKQWKNMETRRIHLTNLKSRLTRKSRKRVWTKSTTVNACTLGFWFARGSGRLRKPCS